MNHFLQNHKTIILFISYIKYNNVIFGSHRLYYMMIGLQINLTQKFTHSAFKTSFLILLLTFGIAQFAVAQCDEPSSWDTNCNSLGENNNIPINATLITPGVYIDLCLTDGDEDWYYMTDTGDPAIPAWYFLVKAVEGADTTTSDCGFYDLHLEYDTTTATCNVYTEAPQYIFETDTYIELYRAIAPNSLVRVTADDNSGTGNYSRIDDFCSEASSTCLDIISITDERITFYLPTHPSCSFSDYFLLIDGEVVNWFFTYDLSLGEWIGWVDNLEPCTSYMISFTAVCQGEEYFSCSEIFETECPPSPLNGTVMDAPKRIIYLDQSIELSQGEPNQLDREIVVNLTAYPNPAIDIVNIYWSRDISLNSPESISIFTSDGIAKNCPVIDQGIDHLRIDVSGLTMGLYHVILSSAVGDLEVTKFIIGH